MSEPKTHVLRARLPWRADEHLTECGLPAADHETLDRPTAAARWKEWGPRRAALIFCMTCVDTANHWPNWDDDPATVMSRECGRGRWREAGDDPPRLERELRALAALAEAHADEFADLLAGLAEVSSLADRRRAARDARRRA